MFTPINPPPTEHHQFSTGHSTENGDSAKTVGEKINAGFKHVYGVLAGMGASLSDEIEYVAKSEFDLLVHELEEAKAELRNIKMMVQGLGSAGARVTDPSHSMKFTDPDPLATAKAIVAAGSGPAATHGMTGLSWAGLTGSSEPLVTVKTVEGEALPADTVIPADTEITVTVKGADAQ